MIRYCDFFVGIYCSESRLGIEAIEWAVARLLRRLSHGFLSQHATLRAPVHITIFGEKEQPE